MKTKTHTITVAHSEACNTVGDCAKFRVSNSLPLKKTQTRPKLPLHTNLSKPTKSALHTQKKENSANTQKLIWLLRELNCITRNLRMIVEFSDNNDPRWDQNLNHMREILDTLTEQKEIPQ